MLLARIKKFAARCAAGMQSSGRLDPSVLDPVKTQVQRNKTLGEAFFELVEKYGLMGKVGLNVRTGGGSHHFRLIAILPNARRKWMTTRIVETGTSDFFPPGFVKEVRALITDYQAAQWRNNKVTFEIHPTGMTLKEIQEEQAAWAAHCEAMRGDA